MPSNPDDKLSRDAIIERLLTIAREESAQHLFEMSAATLYPALYEAAVDDFDGWDGALAWALKRAVSEKPAAPGRRKRSGGSAGEDEQVERVVTEEAAQPLFARTVNGAFYKVPGTVFGRSGAPEIVATPHAAGVLKALDFLGDPNGVVVFSDRGRYFGVDARMVPQWDGELLDRRIQEVIRLGEGETIVGALPRSALYTSSAHSAAQKRAADRLIHITRQAKGKASLVSDMTYTLDREGREAFLLNEGDAPVAIMAGPQKNSVFCASAQGKAIHFDAQDIRSMGLQAVGVNVMKLDGDHDAIVGAFLGNGVEQVAIITQRGLAKRVEFAEFRPQSRAGAGLQLLRLDPDDRVVAAVACDPAKDLAVITSRGRVQRVAATALPRMGRPAKGNLVVDLFDDEVVMGLSALPCSP